MLYRNTFRVSIIGKAVFGIIDINLKIELLRYPDYNF
jgi:hypothetical protein